MLAKLVATSCLSTKSRVRIVKQLPLAASSCRYAGQVRTPSSPPIFFSTVVFPRPHVFPNRTGMPGEMLTNSAPLRLFPSGFIVQLNAVF